MLRVKVFDDMGRTNGSLLYETGKAKLIENSRNEFSFEVLYDRLAAGPRIELEWERLSIADSHAAGRSLERPFGLSPSF